MDTKTINHYDANAGLISERHASIIPLDLYPLVHTYFLKGGKTLDLGCGMGRDTKWLSENGFPTEGVDASDGMLKEANRRFPDLDFKMYGLPDLKGLDKKFDNVYSCAVLMHISRPQLLKAITRIL